MLSRLIYRLKVVFFDVIDVLILNYQPFNFSAFKILNIQNSQYSKFSSFQNLLIPILLIPNRPHSKLSSSQILLIPNCPHFSHCLYSTMVSVCTWYPLKSERNISQTKNLHLQYLYALNFHLMKVLSLLFFTERLYKASNTFM